jgi:BirA family biotin operon repressor/biotin-[acetyl-CoA-carboxylase] ligase
MILSNLQAPFRLIALKRVNSTNDEIKHAIITRDACHALIVLAEEQVTGRGRRGCSWVSTIGNLHCSFLLYQSLKFGLISQLAIVMALTVRDALAELVPTAEFQIKWPNDILCNKCKISGILLEQEFDFVIVGIGINIIHAPKQRFYPTTCLRDIGSNVSIIDVLFTLCKYVDIWYERWCKDGFSSIHQYYMRHIIGGSMIVKITDKMIFDGIFSGIDDDGALLIDSINGSRKKISTGDVFI